MPCSEDGDRFDKLDSHVGKPLGVCTQNDVQDRFEIPDNASHRRCAEQIRVIFQLRPDAFRAFNHAQLQFEGYTAGDGGHWGDRKARHFAALKKCSLEEEIELKQRLAVVDGFRPDVIKNGFEGQVRVA